ncbi:hypothetical protein EVAR_45597_1 [Eumeta japonica]|uniref:Uncharacterized protein n=1 Tax=Eumeta variegata TaxID=151549 RepID=A0A4C1YT34_EUMVA|nr:hypothetical protein EVAR_45597_1 [Eumeta japonica]
MVTTTKLIGRISSCSNSIKRLQDVTPRAAHRAQSDTPPRLARPAARWRAPVRCCSCSFFCTEVREIKKVFCIPRLKRERALLNRMRITTLYTLFFYTFNVFRIHKIFNAIGNYSTTLSFPVAGGFARANALRLAPDPDANRYLDPDLGFCPGPDPDNDLAPFALLFPISSR